jgi:hypothetical protein
LSAEQIDRAPMGPAYEITVRVILEDVSFCASVTKHFNNSFLQRYFLQSNELTNSSPLSLKQDGIK